MGDVKLPNVLLLKISPPMQSWGVGDLYDSNRKTNRFPTKSGVIGMIAAAMGWDRNHDLNDLNKLKMGVRVDSPGNLEKDYQVIKKPGEANGKPSNRWYLSDAVFIVALQSDDLGLLESIESALRDPVFNLYAGRKAFPLNFDLVQGIREGTNIQELFDSLDWMGRGDKPDKIEVIRDANFSDLDVETVSDIPVNFELDHREWALRTITRSWMNLNHPANSDIACEDDGLDWLDMDDDQDNPNSLNDFDFMTGEEM